MASSAASVCAPAEHPKTGRIEHHVEFKQVTPQELFDWYLDSEKHGDMVGSKAEISREVGKEFKSFQGKIEGKTEELVNGRKIVQSWRASDFPEGHFSRLTLSFCPTENGTHLHLVHEDCPLDKVASLTEGWFDYYFKPMKRYIENEKGWKSSVCHVDIPCSDIDRASKFYADTFEWDIIDAGMEGYKLYSCKRKTGSSVDGGLYKTDKVVTDKAVTIYVWVDDIPTALKRVQKNGGKVLKEKYPIGPHGYAADIRDSEGNWMALYTLPDGHDDPEVKCNDGEDKDEEQKKKKRKVATIQSVCHVDIPAKHLARATRFYEDAFNWHFTKMPGYNYFNSARKTGSINGGVYQADTAIVTDRATKLYIWVQSVDDTIPLIEKAGGTIVKPKYEIGPNAAHGYTCEFHDSEGNYLALWQEPPKQEKKDEEKSS